MLLVMAALTLARPVVVSAQSGTQPQTVANPGVAHALRVSSGDLLEIGVFDTPELSGKLRVNEAGEITVPIAGVLRVSGMTSDEVAVAVEDKLRSEDILKYPHVSVLMSEYATQGVTVTGEVKSPGIYPLLGSHGLVDLLSAAGGVSPSAGRIVSVTHKSDQEHPEMIRLDNRPGRIVANVDIEPGDTIIVSRAGVAYIVGDVTKPGGFLIEANDRLTVLQLIALAQGATRTSAQDKAHLIRKIQNGREEIPIPLKAMMRGTVMDMPLEDGDILFVPSSKGKIFAYRGVESAIGLTTGLVLAGKL
jgi:polysaccharide export outer membrane protein